MDEPATSAMAPPGFQKASEVFKASNPPVGGSMRNASGGLPPIPKPVEPSPTASAAVLETADRGAANGGALDPAVDPAAPVKPVKPINRPATSKNAIVYNAVQVGLNVVHEGGQQYGEADF
jgi:hypothetical protein